MNPRKTPPREEQLSLTLSEAADAVGGGMSSFAFSYPWLTLLGSGRQDKIAHGIQPHSQSLGVWVWCAGASLLCPSSHKTPHLEFALLPGLSPHPTQPYPYGKCTAQRRPSISLGDILQSWVPASPCGTQTQAPGRCPAWPVRQDLPANRAWALVSVALRHCWPSPRPCCPLLMPPQLGESRVACG